jgi:hypothetical protein
MQQDGRSHQTDRIEVAPAPFPKVAVLASRIEVFEFLSAKTKD